MDVTWLACDLKSGAILGELPLATDRVRRLVGREETQQWTLPVHDASCPEDWFNITTPGRRMLVLCIDDVPVQGWAITSRRIGTGGVELGGATFEHLLARTNVISLSGEGDEAVVLGFIMVPAAIKFGITFDWANSGQLGEANYSAEEDMSCLQALNERASTEDGVEWRFKISRDGPTIIKTLEIKKRVGQTRPNAIFELTDTGDGNISSYQRSTDYGPDTGATHVIGVSDGSGFSRPMTDPLVSRLVPQGWPEWEARPRFSNVDGDSVADEDAELRRLARETLKKRERGTTTWEVTGDATAPRPGVDFEEGDTVPIRVAPQGKADPVGGEADMRVLGWDLDLNSGQVTLIAWEEPTE